MVKAAGGGGDGREETRRLQQPAWREPRAAHTDSSTDSAYNVPYYNGSPVYHSPYTTGTWRGYSKTLDRSPPRAPPVGNYTFERAPPTEDYTFPQCASALSLPLCSDNEHYPYPHPVTARTPLPHVISVSPDAHIIGACGGHCPGFEYVCYYILQIIFVVGILTGISLCIAGVVLHRSNRGGDLGVLVYIGCLSSCVCAVLLGVQCCVRREIRQRKKRATTHIPLQTIPKAPAQACPLIQTTLPHHVYRPTTTICHEEETGVPWWRRYDRD